MKKVIIGVTMVVMLACAVVVWAADENQAKKEQTQPPVRVQQTPNRTPAGQMRGRTPGMPGPGGVQQAYEEFAKKRDEEHKKGIAELEEIKKIAEGEKAVKTVEALQKMIDKKNADFKKATEESEKKRAEMQKSIQQRQQQIEAQKDGTPPVTPGEKVKEKAPVKKADK